MAKKRWICEYCNNDFASKQGRTKHQINHCQVVAALQPEDSRNGTQAGYVDGPDSNLTTITVTVHDDTESENDRDRSDSADLHGSQPSEHTSQQHPQKHDNQQHEHQHPYPQQQEQQQQRSQHEHPDHPQRLSILAASSEKPLVPSNSLYQNFRNNLLAEMPELRDLSKIASKLAMLGSDTMAEKEASSADRMKNSEEGSSPSEPKIDIVCLAKGDYIKKIIQLYDGDEEKAMNYIKNIGIATDFLEGDFRLIKKVYFDGKMKSQFPIRVKDFKRNKLEYLEENGEWIIDIRGEIVGKRLCENLVNTLLIANTLFNDVIINEKDEEKKELLLDLFQINRTQAHIMKLMERKTQGKLSRRVAEFINYCSEVHAETGSLDNVKKAYSE